MPHRLWLILHEPRVITAFQSLVWLLYVAIGFAAIISPPMTIAHELGPTLTGVWAAFLFGGGVFGFAGCVPGWYWVERAGIYLTITGAIAYLIVVGNLHATTVGNRLVQAGFILSAILSLVVRHLRVGNLQTDPTRGMERRDD